MPSAVLRVAAVGTYDAWILGPGANKVVAVDSGNPVTHDDATTSISSAIVGNKESYTLLSAGSPAIGAISAISIGIRDQDNTGASTIGAFVRVGGVDGVQQTYTASGTGVWTTRTISNPLKSGSVAVQGGDVRYSDPNFQIVIQYVNTGVTTHTVSTFWMDMTFSAPPGGFIALISSFLGPLVAVGIHEIPKLAGHIHRLTKGDLLIQPEEYVALYRELREGRRAKHFLMGRLAY